MTPTASISPTLLRHSVLRVTTVIGLALIAALAWWGLDSRSNAAARADRQQFDQALIATLYGNQYRNLAPTPERPPLRTLHNRYPELSIGPRLDSAFANSGNGYVLLMWVEAMPERRRLDFLFGLDLVIDETSRSGGDVAQAINRFHDNFQISIAADLPRPGH